MPNSWINRKTRDDIYKRDSILVNDTLIPICCYCGKHCVTGVANSSKLTKAEKKAIGTLDHIVPQKILAESSANDKEFFRKRRDPKNLVLVCMGCNSSKQHTELYTWCANTNRDYYKIQAEIMRRTTIEI